MVVLVVGLWCAGCIQGRFLPAVRDNFPATAVDKIVVHFTDCPKQVQMIGSVIVDASEPITQGSMIERLRVEAAKGGGHGICKIQYRKTKGGSLLPGAGEYDPSGFKNATCLVFRFP